MSNSIKISPKHGINPTIPICFFCGEEKNEIALLGRINRNDDKAPMTCLLNYEPCEKCQKLMDKGITIIEAKGEPNFENQPEIASNVYPTGTWHVVSEDFIKKNITPPELVDNILKHRKTFVEPGVIRTTP